MGARCASPAGIRALSGLRRRQCHRHLWRAAAIAAQDGVGRVMSVHGEADEADCGEAPVALAVFVQPQMAGLAAGAAAQDEELLRPRWHRAESKGASVLNVPAARFDADQTGAMTFLRILR